MFCSDEVETFSPHVRADVHPKKRLLSFRGEERSHNAAPPKSTTEGIRFLRSKVRIPKVCTGGAISGCLLCFTAPCKM